MAVSLQSPYLCFVVLLIVDFIPVPGVGLSRTADDEVKKINDDYNSSHSADRDGVKIDHFGYNRVDGPPQWPRIFHSCGGQKQSPISLDTTTAHVTHKPMLSWWGYSLKPVSMALVNNGHTVLLKGKWDLDVQPYNWDSSDMDDVYVFDHLHFHWGPDDDSGSEHTLNCEKFPLEMHAVHFRKSLKSVSDAVHVQGGLKVIAILFRISEHNNSALNNILVGLNKVHQGSAQASIVPFKLSKFLPEFGKQYLTYNGSLTTPPCSESVTWVVHTHAEVVSQQQVEHFRQLSDDESSIITNNHRPVQPLNGRLVLHVV